MGKKVKWIESKALFGDPRTHRVYSKKQYLRYKEMFGEGYVVYWFGSVRGLGNVNLLPNNFFSSKLQKALLDMKIFTVGVDAFGDDKFTRMLKRLSISCFVNLGTEVPVPSIEIPELSEREDFHEHMRTKDFLSGMSKLIELYSKGRIMMVCRERNWRTCHRRYISWVLKNLGFDVVHMKT
jgi:hypothetical protein